MVCTWICCSWFVTFPLASPPWSKLYIAMMFGFSLWDEWPYHIYHVLNHDTRGLSDFELQQCFVAVAYNSIYIYVNYIYILLLLTAPGRLIICWSTKVAPMVPSAELNWPPRWINMNQPVFLNLGLTLYLRVHLHPKIQYVWSVFGETCGMSETITIDQMTYRKHVLSSHPQCQKTLRKW